MGGGWLATGDRTRLRFVALGRPITHRWCTVSAATGSVMLLLTSLYSPYGRPARRAAEAWPPPPPDRVVQACTARSSLRRLAPCSGGNAANTPTSTPPPNRSAGEGYALVHRHGWSSLGGAVYEKTLGHL